MLLLLRHDSLDAARARHRCRSSIRGCDPGCAGPRSGSGRRSRTVLRPDWARLGRRAAVAQRQLLARAVHVALILPKREARRPPPRHGRPGCAELLRRRTAKALGRRQREDARGQAALLRFRRGGGPRRLCRLRLWRRRRVLCAVKCEVSCNRLSRGQAPRRHRGRRHNARHRVRPGVRSRLLHGGAVRHLSRQPTYS
jgi:hypothetical protein